MGMPHATGSICTGVKCNTQTGFPSQYEDH
jgi:hypothetical protein